jgi:hypothetical protein
MLAKSVAARRAATVQRHASRAARLQQEAADADAADGGTGGGGAAGRGGDEEGEREKGLEGQRRASLARRSLDM